jgi:hypothetical protein
MRFTRHVRHRIAAFADAALDATETAHIESHLKRCASCREALERHRSVAVLLNQVAPVEAPAEIWTAIESALERPASRVRATGRVWAAQPAAWVMALGALVLIVTAGTWWLATRPAAWDVVLVDQTRASRMADGQWLETDSASTAALRIGEIGRVELAPGTRLQVVTARPEEHRLNLAVGRISVEIVAPPRVFFVETPMSTVVDLGCAYTMEVGPDGGGILRVTNGWASLEWRGRQSLVPAGASGETRPSFGPGTPSFDDATEAFRSALGEFDFGAGKDDALAVVLDEARGRDTLTLWHLMSRVAESERLRVFERLVSLTSLPEGVTRDKALALDADTMQRWREELAWTW